MTDTLEHLLAEIRALAPPGSSVSVSHEIWSHGGGARCKHSWQASVHTDEPCPHGRIAFELAESPELLVAKVGVSVAASHGCSCADDRRSRGSRSDTGGSS